ncbi:MAG TPA: serine hydrolase, partial [Mycobacteriales bacterium]|nr:serine hydrolase [Mycobacteriales bacterium]
MALRRKRLVRRSALLMALALAAPLLGAAAPSSAAASSPPPSSCTARDPVPPGLADELAARYPGRRFTAAVYEPTGCTYSLNPDLRLTTASVVKTQIMTALLLRAQRQGRSLTTWERDRIWPMITQSADPPTNELWSSLGGREPVQAVARELGMHDTVHPDRYWGITTTSAADQVRLLRQVVPGEYGPLTAASRAEARHYLTSVVPSQRWGASARVPSGWTVAMKNGFYSSQCCRWRLNTAGWVERPDGTGWAVVVLSDGWSNDSEGIAAVHELTGRLNAAMLESPLSDPASAFTGPAGAPERQDVFVRGADGALWQRVWTPGAGLGPWRSLGGRLTSSPDAVPGGTSVPDVVARGSDAAAWRFRWTGRAWAQEPLGGVCASGPSAAASPGRFDVACRGTDGRLYLRTLADGPAASGWTALGGRITGDPDVAADGGPVPRIVARGVDDGVWLFAWDGRRWTHAPLGGRCRSAPTAVQAGGSMLTVACRGTDDALWLRTEQDGAWGGWRSAGGVLLSGPDGAGGGGRAQLLARGADGGVWGFVPAGSGS